MKKLKRLIEMRGISESELSRLTDIPKSTLSRLLKSGVIPAKEYQRKLIDALELPKDFFSQETLSVAEAADLMGVSAEFIRRGLQDKVLPFGYAVKMDNRWVYWIGSKLFSQHTGIDTNNIIT